MYTSEVLLRPSQRGLEAGQALGPIPLAFSQLDCVESANRSAAQYVRADALVVQIADRAHFEGAVSKSSGQCECNPTHALFAPFPQGRHLVPPLSKHCAQFHFRGIILSDETCTAGHDCRSRPPDFTHGYDNVRSGALFSTGRRHL